MTAEPLRVMADSMVFDACVEDSATGRTLADAIADGRLKLVVTVVQQLQLEAIPDEAKRARIASIPRAFVPTSVFVLGKYAFPGAVRLGDGEIYSEVVGTPKHEADAIIADTAVADGLPLVTSDRQLRARALRAGVEVLSVEELIAHIE